MHLPAMTCACGPGMVHAVCLQVVMPRSASADYVVLLFPAPMLAQGSPSSKGCGLVVMRSYADAAAAIAGLNNYRWEGMHSAMVVKLMPPQRQRQEQLQAQGQLQRQQQQLETATSGKHRAYASPGSVQADTKPCVSAIQHAMSHVFCAGSHLGPVLQLRGCTFCRQAWHVALSSVLSTQSCHGH